MIPLAYIGISILILFLTYTYASLQSIYRNYKLRSNAAKLLSTTDDEPFDSDEEVFIDEDSEGHDSESTLIDSLPQNTKVSVIEDRPTFERIWVTAEILLLLGELALSIFSIIKGEGWRSIAVVGHVQWVYLLILALLRLSGTKRTRTLWSHSVMIYILLWPIAFSLLRSAVLGGGNLDLGVQIANVVIVTGLCGLVLTSRAGNKAVKLVSTNGLTPTRVRPHKMLFTVGTDCKFTISCNL